jgi:hypothetical protein
VCVCGTTGTAIPHTRPNQMGSAWGGSCPFRISHTHSPPPPTHTLLQYTRKITAPLACACWFHVMARTSSRPCRKKSRRMAGPSSVLRRAAVSGQSLSCVYVLGGGMCVCVRW